MQLSVCTIQTYYHIYMSLSWYCAELTDLSMFTNSLLHKDRYTNLWSHAHLSTNIDYTVWFGYGFNRLLMVCVRVTSLHIGQCWMLFRNPCYANRPFQSNLVSSAIIGCQGLWPLISIELINLNYNYGSCAPFNEISAFVVRACQII